MTDLERRILLNCRIRELDLREQTPKLGGFEGDSRERCRQAGQALNLADEVKYGPRWNAASWGLVDGLGEAGQKRAIRAVHKLVEAGLLRGTRTCGRLSHVKLTRKGLQAVTAIVAEPEES